jgi:hypothetical protein
MNAYWRAHFARVVRETERLLCRKRKRKSADYATANHREFMLPVLVKVVVIPRLRDS